MPNFVQLLVVLFFAVTAVALLWSGILWLMQTREEYRLPYGHRPRSKPGLSHSTFGEIFASTFTVLGGAVGFLLLCITVLAIIL